MTFLGICSVSYFCSLLIGCWLLGCGECTRRWPDGSCASDSGPVMASELEGSWCEEPDSRGAALCLSVQQSLDGRVWYRWGSWQCSESGMLTGGLEFTPVEGSCISNQFYSASVDWTNTGIEVFLDSGQALKLDWQD